MGAIVMDSIFDLFQAIMSMGSPWNMVVLVVLITCTTGVFTSMFKQFRKYGCHRRDVDLKRDLVERGPERGRNRTHRGSERRREQRYLRTSKTRPLRT